MGQVIPFPNRRRGVLWMTLDELELHAATRAADLAADELHLLRLRQFCKQQETHGEEWR